MDSSTDAETATALTPKCMEEKTFAKLLAGYNQAKNRVLLLDYDGTLKGFAPTPEGAFPDEELLELLKKLVKDPKNTVVVISGRDSDTLGKWLGGTGVNLVCEHGGMTRKAAKGQWEVCDSILAVARGPKADWKKDMRPVLQDFVEKTQGALMEEKRHALGWHYRRSDPELGKKMGAELIAKLEDYTHDSPLEVMKGNCVVEIKVGGVDKGIAAQPWLANSPDFVFSIGDDVTDEFMFAALPKDKENVWSIKVGTAKTCASYYIENCQVVRKILGGFLESN